MAIALGAATTNQSAADAQGKALEKAKAWCRLSVASIGTARATAGGTLTVDVVPPSCKLEVATKATCQGRCAESAPCDVAANPMACTGGVLSGGFCVGGKLEGGCKVDARCDANCDASVAAFAQCPAPPVTITIVGAANAASAASLESALEAHLPTVLGLKAHFETEAALASIVTGNADTVSDLRPVCIPPVIAAAINASEEMTAGLSASSEVVSAAQ